jgi:hypothetical protein
VKRYSRYPATTCKTIAGFTIAINSLIASFVTEATNNVLAFRGCDCVLTESNHPHFRVKLLRSINRFSYFGFFEGEHFYLRY